MAYTRRQTKVKMEKCGGECGQSPRPRAWGASTGLLIGLKRAGGQSERSIWSSGQGLGFFCRGEKVAAFSSGHMGSSLLVDEGEVTPTSAQDSPVAPRARGEKSGPTDPCYPSDLAFCKPHP